MAMMRLRREDPRVVGSFRLHRRLGAGGMGVVYLGSDKKGQRVALKVIRPDLAEDQEFRSRFAREVSAARRIRGGCTARLVAADLEADPGPVEAPVRGSGPAVRPCAGRGHRGRRAACRVTRSERSHRTLRRYRGTLGAPWGKTPRPVRRSPPRGVHRRWRLILLEARQSVRGHDVWRSPDT